MGPRNIIVAVVLVTALAAGIFVAARLEQTPPELQAALVLPAPTPLPEFTLLDQAGGSVTRATFRDRWSLVFFGFTHCPDICPTTLQVLAAARDSLHAAGHRPLPRIVLVSVDPERDTPEVIGRYVNYFGDDNLGVPKTRQVRRYLWAGPVGSSRPGALAPRPGYRKHVAESRYRNRDLDVPRGRNDLGLESIVS